MPAVISILCALVGPAPAPAPAPEATPAPAIPQPRTYPDRPIRWRLDVALGGGTTLQSDAGFLAFSGSSRHLRGLGLTVRADVPLARGRVFLGGGVGYRWSTSTGSIHDGVAFTDLDVHDVLGLARASLRTFEGWDLYLEGGVGPGIVLTSVSTDQHFGEDRRIVPAFEGLGGITLYLPKAWLPRRGSSRVTGGLDLGFGYAFHGRAAVRPSADVDDDAIETRGTDLGDVAPRGILWRIGAFVRFM